MMTERAAQRVDLSLVLAAHGAILRMVGQRRRMPGARLIRFELQGLREDLESFDFGLELFDLGLDPSDLETESLVLDGVVLERLVEACDDALEAGRIGADGRRELRL